MTIIEDEQHFFEEETDKESPLTTENEPKGPPQACLFVASLSSETREETLAECFGEFGKVLKIKFLKDRSARPYAFVQYLDIEDAENALEHTNGMILDNRRLRVERAKVNRTLFLAKLSRDMSNNQLREVVEEFGPVESVTIIKNHQTNKSKGCGFVKFVYREDAIEAFIGLKNKNRKWVIEWATSTNDPDLLGVDKLNIFVGGLNPKKIDKQLLEQRFGVYGEIESITLINRNPTENDSSAPDAIADPSDSSPTNPDASAHASSDSLSDSHSSAEEFDAQHDAHSQRSAFAFVRYKDLAHSASAIENENGSEWLERRIRVQYCESQEMKNKRRANKFFQLNNAFATAAYGYPQGMQLPAPMLMMGSHLPPLAPYNLPARMGSPKFANLYSKHPNAHHASLMDADAQNNMFPPNSYVAPYPVFAYNTAPWLYGPPHQVHLENPLSPPLDSDELSDGSSPNPTLNHSPTGSGSPDLDGVYDGHEFVDVDQIPLQMQMQMQMQMQGIPLGSAELSHLSFNHHMPHPHHHPVGVPPW